MSNTVEMAHKLIQTTPYGLDIQVALPYEVAVEGLLKRWPKRGSVS